MPQMMTRREVAERLQMSRKYLDALSMRGEGPPCVRVGSRAVRYDPAVLAAWLADRAVVRAAAP